MVDAEEVELHEIRVNGVGDLLRQRRGAADDGLLFRDVEGHAPVPRDICGGGQLTASSRSAIG